jgi:hypothetical protein
MRLGLVVVATVSLSAATLQVADPVVRQSDGGTPLAADFAHVPGETLFFSFLVAGYQPASDGKVRLSYTIHVLDPAGVRLVEPVAAALETELAPQDKEWKPRVRREIQVPPLAPSGAYQILVRVSDEVARTSAEKQIAFHVRGRDVAPSPTLTVRNFRFFRGEDDTEALAKAAYRPGDAVWARFDITGFKYGPANRIDVSYGVAVQAAGGRVLWSQPEAAHEASQSFYPQPYVPGAMGITLQPTIRPGMYAVAVRVRDAIGGQDFECQQNFEVIQ